MKKRIILILLAFVMLIVATCTTVACKFHKHELEEVASVSATCTENGNINCWRCKTCYRYYTDKSASKEISKDETEIAIDSENHDIIVHNSQAPTCTDIGWDEYVSCSRCSYTTYNELPEIAHVFKCIPSDNIRHLYKCNNCSYVKKENHTVENDVCTKCNYTIKSHSEGLKLTRKNDCYTVSGIGTCTDTEIIIPSEIDGIPVTAIGYDAFRYRTWITSVTIPDSITDISYGAFEYCSSLKNIILHDGIISIGEAAFAGCTSLTDIILPNKIINLRDGAFANCTSLTGINLPDSVEYIGQQVFQNCTSLASINIPNSVTFIGWYAFLNCSSLTEIIIPSSVTKMGNAVFADCSSLTIYCELPHRLFTWEIQWNYSDRPVVWNYRK